MSIMKQTVERSTMIAPVPLPNVPPTVGQPGRGMARRIGRYLAEPAFIAGCGLAGALYGVQYGHPPGHDPVIGMAGFAASLATLAGLTRLMAKACWARAYTLGTLGGATLRLAVLLLCFAFEIYGLSCICDDVSQAAYPQGTVRFE